MIGNNLKQFEIITSDLKQFELFLGRTQAPRPDLGAQAHVTQARTHCISVLNSRVLKLTFYTEK